MGKFSDKKKNNIMKASIAGLVIFVASFVMLETYEVIVAVKRVKTVKALDAEITRLEKVIESKESELDKWEEEWQILQRARELGLYENEEDE